MVDRELFGEAAAVTGLRGTGLVSFMMRFVVAATAGRGNLREALQSAVEPDAFMIEVASAVLQDMGGSHGAERGDRQPNLDVRLNRVDREILAAMTGLVNEFDHSENKRVSVYVLVLRCYVLLAGSPQTSLSRISKKVYHTPSGHWPGILAQAMGKDEKPPELKRDF